MAITRCLSRSAGTSTENVGSSVLMNPAPGVSARYRDGKAVLPEPLPDMLRRRWGWLPVEVAIAGATETEQGFTLTGRVIRLAVSISWIGCPPGIRTPIC
jgi:hypothetical protein